MSLWNYNTNILRVADMKDMLKGVGSYASYNKKSVLQEKINIYKQVMNFPWRKDQQDVIDAFLEFKYNIYVVNGIFGAGKCFSENTPVLMYDGSIKMVQDVVVGDVLMGDDSKPRNVLALGRGEDEMYDIIPNKGDKYTVNSEHILCLKASGWPRLVFDKTRNKWNVGYINDNKFKHKRFETEKEGKEFLEDYKNNILEITVKDYLKLSDGYKSYLKGYRVGVNFEEKDIDIDPYMIGLWLGDGTSSSCEITSVDEEIIEYLENYCKKNELNIKIKGKGSSKITYSISGMKKDEKGFKRYNNTLLKGLQKYNLIKNKHIPEVYKCNSRENRLRLLAGLIDTDGSYSKERNIFSFCQKNEKLMDDVVYLCKSLGFACYKKIKKTSWTYNGVKKYGTAFRISIMGKGIEEIPTLIKRKMASPRKQIKDVLNVKTEVKSVGRGKYYGFQIDGNGRFLLGDFTVTHNTTMLLGMIILGLIKQNFKPDETMFISFNLSIKNEITKKLKKYGIGNKVVVRTFDSIIYEICKNGNYKHINLPNFEGKRKFAYEISYEESFNFYPAYQPKVIFVDESQDIERNMIDILYRFYPKTKFVFAGDVYQSIQKEPRESILWYYMLQPEREDVFKLYMKETPRVPPNVLTTLQKSLKTYYPEFKDEINTWVSANTVSNADIEWKRFNSYQNIFNDLKEYLDDPRHTPENTMIITFSSAITVRGAMGDIARVRRFMMENNYKVNTNHKKMDDDAYFLTTAHSSKGLERDNVIIFLTFPLELAFVHLSDDVVINLITVALSRAKKKVLMYVPAYEDKFTPVLSIFDKCPNPNKKRIREGKTIKEFSFQDYIDIEHCVTELIRASVVKYDTRIIVTQQTKMYKTEKLFRSGVNYRIPPISTEEERCFVGVLIENLITSTWENSWPPSPMSNIVDNPMYVHIVNRLKNLEKKYLQFSRSQSMSYDNQFKGIYLYSQLHIAISNKVFINLTTSLKEHLEQYWRNLKPKAIEIKPKEKDLKVQAPVQMPWVTGIADAISTEEKEMSLYEIKASKDRDWKNNALLQVVIYALMSGKSWSRLHLLNPLSNEHLTYYFDSKKILSLRNEILKDILIYNINSMMAKKYPEVKIKELPKINTEKLLFLYVNRNVDKQITQISILKMLSPIKCEYIYNKHVSNNLKKDKKMDKTTKKQTESEISLEDLLKEVNNMLSLKLYKDYTIISWDKVDEIKQDMIYTKEEYKLEKFQDIIDYFKYKKNEELKYSLDFDDSFSCVLILLAYNFYNKYFV